MRHARLLCCLLVIFSFTLLQFSGLHRHVSSKTNSQELHGSHAPGFDRDHHEHAASVDVALFELSNIVRNVLPLLAIIVALFVFVRSTLDRPIHRGSTLATHSRSRWRPPLRAPPVSIV